MNSALCWLYCLLHKSSCWLNEVINSLNESNGLLNKAYNSLNEANDLCGLYNLLYEAICSLHQFVCSLHKIGICKALDLLCEMRFLSGCRLSLVCLLCFLCQTRLFDLGKGSYQRGFCINSEWDCKKSEGLILGQIIKVAKVFNNGYTCRKKHPVNFKGIKIG